MIPFLLFCSILILLEFIVEQQAKERAINIKYWLLLAGLIVAFIYEIVKFLK